ncbi:GNAT family N-acetyltransferase [Chitinophaga parva]|uniref:GNAT family N-acetyltransferase n=1 Tax=Chitinophaga parva TaxID=2169414 RepID=A0A2T7BH83_9BACT|nr:GNAT family N-acetyltransferase [Chitinophaga parva]PUZ25639.1 GNAT family N-acetyltransferase [Chitinophaga parva]
MENVQYARTAEQIAACWLPIQALRPHLDAATFVQVIQEMMETGYQLIYIADAGKPVAIAGFREEHKLVSGKTIYIDDLSTLASHRGRGLGGRLLDFIHTLARQQGKDGVYLDSGHQRHDAHRLYLNKGYTITAHHFTNKNL